MRSPLAFYTSHLDPEVRMHANVKGGGRNNKQMMLCILELP